MTRTVQDVIDAARDCINDTDKVRYGDPALIRFVREGVNYLLLHRPDLFIGAWTIADLTNGGDTLPVPDAMFQPMVHFVTGMAEIKDDEYAVNGRASTVLALAERYLK